MLTVGIDPGLGGALALVSRYGSSIELINVEDMPTTPKTGKGGNQLDPSRLCAVLSDWSVRLNHGAPIHTWIERVGAMPGQGVTSMFSFGEGCGVLRGVLGAMGWPIHYVAPISWKKAVGLKGFDKVYALTVAKQLLPATADQFTAKKHLGRADAALIAYYGAKYGQE